MGLFDKKYCDICGEKIGLLGNRKLEDGNLCKDCARKLSPFFSERRNSTVEDIKRQLAYRAENEKKLVGFAPSITFDGSKKVYIDPIGERFIVTGTAERTAVVFIRREIGAAGRAILFGKELAVRFSFFGISCPLQDQFLFKFFCIRLLIFGKKGFCSENVSRNGCCFFCSVLPPLQSR